MDEILERLRQAEKLVAKHGYTPDQVMGLMCPPSGPVTPQLEREPTKQDWVWYDGTHFCINQAIVRKVRFDIRKYGWDYETQYVNYIALVIARFIHFDINQFGKLKTHLDRGIKDRLSEAQKYRNRIEHVMKFEFTVPRKGMAEDILWPRESLNEFLQDALRFDPTSQDWYRIKYVTKRALNVVRFPKTLRQFEQQTKRFDDLELLKRCCALFKKVTLGCSEKDIRDLGENIGWGGLSPSDAPGGHHSEDIRRLYVYYEKLKERVRTAGMSPDETESYWRELWDHAEASADLARGSAGNG